jgi:conjugal transfer mating pair stabilization protein TraN
MLEKIIQVEARKQPALRSNFSGTDGFGSGGNPNCRGLTIEELSLVDFSQIDFSALAAEIFGKAVMPNVNDVEIRVKNSFDRLSKTQGK